MLKGYCSKRKRSDAGKEVSSLMGNWKNKVVDIALSIIFAIFSIVVIAIIIYPALTAIFSIDDFDGYWLIIIIQGFQLAVTFFAVKQLSDIQKNKK